MQFLKIFQLILTVISLGKGERSRAKPVVVSVEYDKLTIGKNSTNLLIRWKSGLGGNASCHANVFFLDEDADDYMPHERKEVK